MLKAYIVDDEPLARDELKYLLIRSKQVDVLGESDCMEDAIADIHDLKPDLVFLDIELAEDSGLDLAKQLENLNSAPAIIFATAYDEFAYQAFELNAVDYILKPFDEERIGKTLEKIKKMQKIGDQDLPINSPLKNSYNGKIAVLVDERIILLTYADIVYLESSEGKCTIETMDQKYKVSEALVVLEKKLTNTKFLRVHRSFIVNIDHIVEIEPWFNATYNLIMKNGSKVPVSRTYVKELKQMLGF
ncbi:LytR/AlgR family response regulator transcription factor [Bacillus sp. 7884-1]|uniref:LytR/AlgR family response regulator transcription factor n=1 Tax=Bacillus sp. 7884-1 TaxID=2021693 RepID=UPI000BA7CDB4|nr:LytTR family transcriptional regulator DNA-binding domain-containing protein [Bacillus sp. 7884-1]PAE43099.1 DNA-binding response regulator [Bacillus sp. 7884-1]